MAMNLPLRWNDGGKQRRAAQIPMKSWELHRSTIEELYKNETLADLVEIMKTNHSFDATERQYTHRLRQWGIYKKEKQKEQDMEFVLESTSSLSQEKCDESISISCDKKSESLKRPNSSQYSIDSTPASKRLKTLSEEHSDCVSSSSNKDNFLEHLWDAWKEETTVSSDQPYGGTVPEIEFGLSTAENLHVCDQTFSYIGDIKGLSAISHEELPGAPATTAKTMGWIDPYSNEGNNHFRSAGPIILYARDRHGSVELLTPPPPTYARAKLPRRSTADMKQETYSRFTDLFFEFLSKRDSTNLKRQPSQVMSNRSSQFSIASAIAPSIGSSNSSFRNFRDVSRSMKKRVTGVLSTRSRESFSNMSHLSKMSHVTDLFGASSIHEQDETETVMLAHNASNMVGG